MNLNNRSTLKILEIGGGRGIFSMEIFSLLQTHNIEYCFTDISRRFVNNMRRQVKNENLINIKCRQFDITKDPFCQQIDCGYNDIIIGLDVIHATPNIIETLNNLNQLLNDKGFFLT